MDILEFIFRGFWTFVGFAILVNTVLYYMVNGVARMWSRLLRSCNIRRHGYPPAHCDADGDFKENT